MSSGSGASALDTYPKGPAVDHRIPPWFYIPKDTRTLSILVVSYNLSHAGFIQSAVSRMDIRFYMRILSRAPLKPLYEAFWFKDLSVWYARSDISCQLRLEPVSSVFAGSCCCIYATPSLSHGSSSPRNDPGLVETRKSLEAWARSWWLCNYCFLTPPRRQSKVGHPRTSQLPG